MHKYVVPERIDVVENGCIRFTQAAALNDPFENNPCFSVFSKSLRERSRRLLKNVEGRFRAHDAVTTGILIPKMVSDKTTEYQRNLRAKYPMLSLTKKRNNLLMWSHYANAHRGFVMGFDSDHSFFHREKPRTMSPLREVKYSRKRLVLPAYEECVTEDVSHIIFLTKSKYWSYEQELRMFAQPKYANVVLKGDDGLDIYLFKFPQESLKEIIFGHQVQADLKRRISEIVKRQYSQVELFETRLNETDFDLDVIRYQLRTIKT